jgi:hypothetical protein
MGARQEQRKRHHCSRKPCRKVIFFITQAQKQIGAECLLELSQSREPGTPMRPIPPVPEPSLQDQRLTDRFWTDRAVSGRRMGRSGGGRADRAAAGRIERRLGRRRSQIDPAGASRGTDAGQGQRRGGGLWMMRADDGRCKQARRGRPLDGFPIWWPGLVLSRSGQRKRDSIGTAAGTRSRGSREVGPRCDDGTTGERGRQQWPGGQEMGDRPGRAETGRRGRRRARRRK